MQSFSHSFGESTYHLWWITECRYKILRKRWHKYLYRDVLKQVVKRHIIKILSLAIGNERVYMVVTIPPTISGNKAFSTA